MYLFPLGSVVSGDKTAQNQPLGASQLGRREQPWDGCVAMYCSRGTASEEGSRPCAELRAGEDVQVVSDDETVVKRLCGWWNSVRL